MTNPNRAAQVGKAAPWPKGKRRNNPTPPREYATIEEFLSVLAVELSRPGGQRDLAEYLGVHHSSVQAWVSGRKMPGQERVTQMGRWLRKQIKV